LLSQGVAMAAFFLAEKQCPLVMMLHRNLIFFIKSTKQVKKKELCQLKCGLEEINKQ
jgi:hypothetical protein